MPTPIKKGGRPTPENAGLDLDHRETLWGRLRASEEGSLFRPSALLTDLPKDAAADFQAMQGHDHLHVADGWHTAIREYAHVRLPPDPVRVAQAWCRDNGWGEPVEFGDWTAWREGLYRWEPLAGYRFRVLHSRAEAVLAVGHTRVRIQDGAPWLMGDTPLARILRALVDMPHKTLRADLQRWMGADPMRGRLLSEVLTRLDALAPTWAESPALAKGESPAVVAERIRAALA